MRKNKSKPESASKVELACKHCVFWDNNTLNQNEFKLNPYQQPTEFACRYLPETFWKKATDWCGQFQAEVKAP